MLHYFKKTNTDVTLDVIFVNFDIYMESIFNFLARQKRSNSTIIKIGNGTKLRRPYLTILLYPPLKRKGKNLSDKRQLRDSRDVSILEHV